VPVRAPARPTVGVVVAQVEVLLLAALALALDANVGRTVAVLLCISCCKYTGMKMRERCRNSRKAENTTGISQSLFLRLISSFGGGVHNVLIVIATAIGIFGIRFVASLRFALFVAETRLSAGLFRAEHRPVRRRDRLAVATAPLFARGTVRPPTARSVLAVGVFRTQIAGFGFAGSAATVVALVAIVLATPVNALLLALVPFLLALAILKIVDKKKR